MKTLINKMYLLIPLGIVTLLAPCCKKGFLDAKPDQSLVVPVNIEEFQALLDNSEIMNSAGGLAGIASDDFEVTAANLASFNNAQERNSYYWAADIYERESGSDWTRYYQQIFYANVAIDGVAKIPATEVNKAAITRVQGSALFYRAYAMYELVEQFAAPYVAATAASLPGVPIKLTSDVNERPGRGTVKDVYDQIIQDLTKAMELLPARQQSLIRPDQLKIQALLARISLTRGEYEKALHFADECLKVAPELMDFNSLSPTATRPIASRGKEVLYYGFALSYGYAGSAITGVHPELLALYHKDDLRKTIFFRDRGNGIVTFKGTYTSTTTMFTGMGTDEMYLIRGECRARLKDKEGAMKDLNTLLKTRWSNKVVYPEIAAIDDEDALRKIITERRKELVSRGNARWSDLRRLNRDNRFAVTLKRTLNGVEYFLPPNDKKYIYPIPANEIENNSIAQNLR